MFLQIPRSLLLDLLRLTARSVSIHPRKRRSASIRQLAIPVGFCSRAFSLYLLFTSPIGNALLPLVFVVQNLLYHKAGWSWGCVSAIDSCGRTIWIADAHRGDGKRFVVRADEKLRVFLELERVTSPCSLSRASPWEGQEISRVDHAETGGQIVRRNYCLWPEERAKKFPGSPALVCFLVVWGRVRRFLRRCSVGVGLGVGLVTAGTVGVAVSSGVGVGNSMGVGVATAGVPIVAGQFSRVGLFARLGQLQK
jgi:hypothetical protein